MEPDHWFDSLHRTLTREASRRGGLGAVTALLASHILNGGSVVGAARKKKRRKNKNRKKKRQKRKPQRQRLACAGEPCLLLGVEPGCCEPGLRCCGGFCVNTTEDDDHCGGCNQPCSPGKVCFGSTCECLERLTLCGEICRDTMRDPNNCGQCGKECEADLACRAGTCEQPCGGACVGPGLECCPIPGTSRRACFDTDSHPAHCGGCDQPCTGDFRGCCDGTCIDAKFNNDHCGGCQPCPPGQECCHGVCIYTHVATCCRDHPTNPNGPEWCPIGTVCCTGANGQQTCC